METNIHFKKYPNIRQSLDKHNILWPHNSQERSW